MTDTLRENLGWLATCVALAIVLSAPGAMFAKRRGIRAGLLAGFATALVVVVVALVGMVALTAIDGGGSTAVAEGAGVAIVFLWMFFAPTYVVGLICAYALRRLRSERA